MKPSLPTATSDKPVAVLGLGRTGRAACRLLREHGFGVEVLDSGSGDDVDKALAELVTMGIPAHTGQNAIGRGKKYSWVVLSPGIDPRSPIVEQFSAMDVPLLSEIEVAWRCCDATVIAITGTNGKTTTTGLIEHLLIKTGHRAIACGNIGLTFSEAVLDHSNADFFVVEVSSFQLEACSSFRPKASVWMNFSPNHLDRYRDVDEYFTAKARIFLWQTKDDFAVHQLGSRLPADIKAHQTTFSATLTGGDFSLQGGWICKGDERILDQSRTCLPGIHNAENLMAALAATNAVGIDIMTAAKAADGYEAPAHRCEPVGEIDGILFVNDSKSTNLDALEKAICSQSRPLVLIAGGKDKGFNYAPLAELAAQRVRHAVLIGQMRNRIAEDWAGTHCVKSDSLAEAVEQAKKLSTKGGVVLFSPGTSSFDMFRDYEARGDAFRHAVLSLAKNSKN
jgi:UDP-N-acetylmuramoylalanine--D-glutamate ligase